MAYELEEGILVKKELDADLLIKNMQFNLRTAYAEAGFPKSVWNGLPLSFFCFVADKYVASNDPILLDFAEKSEAEQKQLIGQFVRARAEAAFQDHLLVMDYSLDKRAYRHEVERMQKDEVERIFIAFQSAKKASQKTVIGYESTPWGYLEKYFALELERELKDTSGNALPYGICLKLSEAYVAFARQSGITPLQVAHSYYPVSSFMESRELRDLAGTGRIPEFFFVRNAMPEAQKKLYLNFVNEELKLPAAARAPAVFDESNPWGYVAAHLAKEFNELLQLMPHTPDDERIEGCKILSKIYVDSVRDCGESPEHFLKKSGKPEFDSFAKSRGFLGFKDDYWTIAADGDVQNVLNNARNALYWKFSEGKLKLPVEKMPEAKFKNGQDRGFETVLQGENTPWGCLINNFSDILMRTSFIYMEDKDVRTAVCMEFGRAYVGFVKSQGKGTDYFATEPSQKDLEQFFRSQKFADFQQKDCPGVPFHHLREYLSSAAYSVAYQLKHGHLKLPQLQVSDLPKPNFFRNGAPKHPHVALKMQFA